MNQEALQRLTKAKSQLVHNHPFFAHIVLSLPLIEDERIKTMATDMKNIYYAPKFVLDHSITELVGVLIHEGLHVAFLHGLRKGTKIHKLWNIACDFAINLIVLDSGAKLPSDALVDEKYRNWSAQDIYNDLLKNVKQQMDACEWGGVDAPKDGQASQAELEEIESEIKIRVQAAAAIAKQRGKLPAGMEGLIEAVGKPKINWHDYIQQWVSGHKPDDYTWQRPNRTWMGVHNLYMPRMKFNGAGVGVLSIDTSGSVSDEELRKFVTEICGVIELCNPDKLYIIQHDAVIQKVDEYESGEDFSSLKTKGRGGTCIRPTFQWIDQHDEPIDWVIIFSDMEIGDWPSWQDWPEAPVLLCGTGPDTSPKGTNAVYIPLRDAI